MAQLVDSVTQGQTYQAQLKMSRSGEAKLEDCRGKLVYIGICA